METYLHDSPFETHLRALSGTQGTLTLTFEQIERLMHSPLPKSALTRQPWWEDKVHSTLSDKYAWLHAGWQMEELELSAKWVRFIRKLQ